MKTVGFCEMSSQENATELAVLQNKVTEYSIIILRILFLENVKVYILTAASIKNTYGLDDLERNPAIFFSNFISKWLI